MDLKSTLGKILEWPAKFLANSGHAQQDIPSQHRLLNAGVMFGGWWALDHVRHAAFGVRMKSEGEYVDVPIEEVPLPLRFLHKSIDWDPHSETPENQWKKLMYQLLPGVGAGAGAALGSIYAFQRNGREQMYKATKSQQVLSLLDADFAAQYAQSTPLRALSAFFGTFSAASGLTFMYGLFLNPAFAAANGAKIFTGVLSKGNLAPHRAVDAQLGMIGSYVEDALKTGKMSDAWAQQFSERVLEPLFGHELRTPEDHTKAVKALQGIVEKSYAQFKANGKPTKEIAAAVTKDLTAKLGKGGLDKTLLNELGLDPKHAIVGNANPVLHQFQEYLHSAGLGKTLTYNGKLKPMPSYAGAMPAIGAAATVGLVAATSSKASAAVEGRLPETGIENSSSEQASQKPHAVIHKHPEVDPAGKTPAEYVHAALAMHNAQAGNGTMPPDWLKWIGDAELAVLPKNRMFCAIGLTSGLMVAGNMAKIATGYGLDGKAVEAEKVPTYLQGMYKIVKDYNPKGLDARNRWIKYAQWAAYSLGGFIGIKIGTDYAYSNVRKKNKDPHYLEDYLPRVAMHQGDTWSWLAASAGIFGSASGLFMLPVPGINYALGLAGRTTSMQDRNFMTPGINGTLSGGTTNSFLRLREGLNFLCHYAVGNPAETPAQIEFLAYTMLGPIFKDELTVAHIQRFTEAVHEVRDQYWKEGGIPKAKRKEALATMREVFTGPGLEVLLIDMGLNPGTISFHELNGITGRIGEIGASKEIQAEQDAYHAALKKHLVTYVEQGLISQERADWVREGMESAKQGKKPMALPPEPPEINAPEATKPFAERMNMKKKPNIETLIDKADDHGDWRTKVNLQPATDTPAVIGG